MDKQSEFADLTPAVARAELLDAAACLDGRHVILLAALLRLGPPGQAFEMHGRIHGGALPEAGDVAAAWSASVRDPSGPRSRACGDADRMFREVASLIGRPLPSPHAVSAPHGCNVCHFFPSGTP